MSDKIDVFEILGQKHTELDTRGQEQVSVPDPDFNEAIKMLAAKHGATGAKKPVAASQPVPKQPAPAKELQPVRTQPAAKAPQPVPKQPAPAKELQPVRTQPAAKAPQPVPKQPVPAKAAQPAPKQPAPAKALQKDAAPRNKRKFLNRDKKEISMPKKLLKNLFVLACILMFFTFVVNISKVSGDSMAPALENGDRVVINRIARNFEKGDIIVFKTESGNKLVKRIVAVDGDVVNITPDKTLYINGSEADEENIFYETSITDISMSYPVILDEEEYFVLGDNRTNSKDSRNSEVGIVQKDDIVGKVVLFLRKY